MILTLIIGVIIGMGIGGWVTSWANDSVPLVKCGSPFRMDTMEEGKFVVVITEVEIERYNHSAFHPKVKGSLIDYHRAKEGK